MKNFKRNHNLDICSLVIVHDGDADYLNAYWIEKEVQDTQTLQTEKTKTIIWYNTNEKNYVMRDRQNKFEVKLKSVTEEVALNTLKWFNHVTGARIFGFFIVTGRAETKDIIKNRYVNEDGKGYWHVQSTSGYDAADQYTKKLLKEFKNEKFISCKVPGYENFFFISGGEELTTDDEVGIEIEGKFTARKLATAFAKYNKKRAVNRVLVSRFIQGIAA